MTNMRNKPVSAIDQIASTQVGATLIELLVGVIIGLFLTGGMIQAYLSTKQTYNITQSVGRIQEDSRFAHHFLTRDLRETSNLGCLKAIRDMIPSPNDLTDLQIGVGGWDYVGTSPSTSNTIALTGNYANSTARNDWNGINNGVNNELPTQISSVAFSDAIVVKKVSPIEGARINTTGNVSSLSVTDYAAIANEMLIVGNCQRADQFVVNSVSAPVANTVTIDPSGPRDFLADWDEEARLYSFSNAYYYISTRAGADKPSLFRWNSKDGTNEELVEGVESMQVLYGLDLNGDGSSNRYVSARDIGATDWDTVVSIRAGLLMAAIGGKDANSAQAVTTYQLADDIVFEAPANDRTMRYIANITVNTRNLGLSTDFSVCTAGSDPTSDCNVLGFIPPSTP